jgi:hypothetical protein
VPLAVWQAQRAALLGRAGANGQVGIWFASGRAGAHGQGRARQLRASSPSTSRSSAMAAAIRSPTTCARASATRANCARSATCCATSCSRCSRCGFDAYATRQDRSIVDALKGLTVFSETYQGSVDQPLPLFRRHQRDVPLEHSDVGAGI